MLKHIPLRYGKSVYLAGVGGCGMRGIANFFTNQGWEVFGADSKRIASKDSLRSFGVHIVLDGEEVPPCSLAIRSDAVPVGDRGFQEAVSKGARDFLYAELLGEISRNRHVLAVAGSHGKTTCTGWIAWGLRAAGRPIGFLVGADVPQLEGSSDWGDSQQPLILESCEYARSFHFLRPAQAALINIDAEHPDTYPGGKPEVLEAFKIFLNSVPKDGVIWAGPEVQDLDDACFGARYISSPELPSHWELALPGSHNRKNGALVAQVLDSFGLTEEQIRFAVENYQGASRRLEIISDDSQQSPLIISDYAHHPVEVLATLQAVREKWPSRRLMTVFQPHQAQRFHAYRDEFAPSLDDSHLLLLLEIYRARDPEELRASIEELVPELRQRNPERPLYLAADFELGRQRLVDWYQPGDIILCLGAGTVHEFAVSLREDCTFEA